MNHYFLSSIKHLREHEEIMLYGSLLTISNEELIHTRAYLQEEFEKESLSYPFPHGPIFNADVAIWAAQTVYLAAQLMLYRENKGIELSSLLPAYTGNNLNPEDILSADLTLRFLTPIIKHLHMIDPEDVLIPILEAHLKTWHYSGIAYPLEITDLNLEDIYKNKYLLKMYTDRVITYKNIALAQQPTIAPWVSASLGIYAKDFWKEYKIKEQIQE